MAKLEVKIKSKEMMKPSSQTPNHLKTLQLTFIDQFVPSVHMPYVFFYQTPFNHNNNNNNSQNTNIVLLKNSLSKTLVQFYPLAGRIEDNLSINCNDEGVEFYEADVLTSLAEVVANPDPEELIRLLPFVPVNNGSSIVTTVQVNQFSCGGMAISVCISHKVADAATATEFINAWGCNARGVPNIDQAKLVTFDSTSFFPSMDLSEMYEPQVVAICKEKTVTRRLIFDKEKLDGLKKQCDFERLESPPTRVSVVCALLWKMFIKIARAKPTVPKMSIALQAVNLRTIKKSPIPENYYGNLFWTTFAHTQTEPETDYTEAVDKLRTAVNKIDTSYLLKIKTRECLLDLQKAHESISQCEADVCAFSSWIRFPFYEANFGWGTPIWVSITNLPFKNMACLLSTKCGQGIEVWMNVLEHDLAALEEDHDFRSLASHIIQA